jgi:ABC-type multidrug transport system ATPase subunit
VNALEVTGLTVRTLTDCSLAIPAGRVAALVGPNGAGKSTLMHTVAGVLTPARGTVRTAGDVEELLRRHLLLSGTPDLPPPGQAVRTNRTERLVTLLSRSRWARRRARCYAGHCPRWPSWSRWSRSPSSGWPG